MGLDEVRQVVSSFTRTYCGANEEAEDTVILDYIVGFVSDSMDDDETLDPDDFNEILLSYFPPYEEVDESIKTAFVDNLKSAFSSSSKPVVDGVAASGPNTAGDVVESKTETNKENIPVQLNIAAPSGDKQPSESHHKVEERHSENKDIEMLMDLCPNLSKSVLVQCVLSAGGNLERAAELALEKQSLKEMKILTKTDSDGGRKADEFDEKLDEKLDSDVRSKILDRFDDQERVYSKEWRELGSKEAKNRMRALSHGERSAVGEKGKAKTRYRDGVVVTTRGERVVVEKEDEPAHMRDTYVSIAIKTKGKRGPGEKKPSK